MPVRIHTSRRIHRTVVPPFDDARILARIEPWASPLLGPQGEGTLNLMFCSDRVMKELNRAWLGRDRPTNVIAFSSPWMARYTDRGGPVALRPGMLDDLALEAGPELHLGDVAVSVDTARREQGDARAKDPRILFLAIHGVLHILGWDHQDQKASRRMNRLTERLCTLSGQRSSSRSR